MSTANKISARYLGKVAIAFVPWVVSMYTLYWLEYGEVWTTATPHRGKISVMILVLGMGISFFLYTRLFDRKKT